MPETTVLRFEQNGVRVRVKEAEELLEPFDTVILAAGMEAEIGLTAELESAGLPFSVIGDALKPADIFSATQAGYCEALALAGKVPER